MPPRFSILDLLQGARRAANPVSEKIQKPLSENVRSEAINRIDWEPSGNEISLESLVTGTMTIEFAARGTYEYYDVPVTEWMNLKSAASKGSYFNNSVRGKYSYSRVG